MRLFIDCGHGQGCRQPLEIDCGVYGDDGTSELAVTRAYGACLLETMRRRGHRCVFARNGSVLERLQRVFRRRSQLIVAFHMDQDISAEPGGAVRYATTPTTPIAEALGAALGVPVVQVEEVGLLLFNPSVEVVLGNIVCWQQMRVLRCAAHCQKVCDQIADTLEKLFLRL